MDRKMTQRHHAAFFFAPKHPAFFEGLHPRETSRERKMQKTEWKSLNFSDELRKVLEASPAVHFAETVEELFWERSEIADERVRGRAVIWHGKLVQERDGAARIMVQGIRTAVSINGRVELPVGPGGRTVDVWLESGTHDLTIFSAMRTAGRRLRT